MTPDNIPTGTGAEAGMQPMAVLIGLFQLAATDHAAWDALRVNRSYTLGEWLDVVLTALDDVPEAP